VNQPIDCVLGTHDPEADRLRVQHELWLDEPSRARKAIGVAPGARVIDPGCGPGLVTEALAERVGPTGRVVGIQLSPNFAAQARARCARFGSAAAIEELDLAVSHLPSTLHRRLDAAWILHAWLFTWLVGVEFRSASHLLPWVVLAGGLFSASQMLSLNNFVDLDSHSLLIPKIVTAVVGAGCNFAGARNFGSIGVVAGLLGFSLIYLV
jgi:SAM-dependent methyltransferase